MAGLSKFTANSNGLLIKSASGKAKKRTLFILPLDPMPSRFFSSSIRFVTPGERNVVPTLDTNNQGGWKLKFIDSNYKNEVHIGLISVAIAKLLTFQPAKMCGKIYNFRLPS